MSIYDPNEIARECVSCKRCYPSNLQFCRDCLVELRDIETIPYMIDARYRLERVINHGGSGIVFVATNEAGQEVAIKIIRASAIAEPREQDRFRLEAQIALNLKHPQIAAILDFGMLPNAYAYIVSEYVKGDSLRDEMKRRGKFDVDDAIQVIAETCEALDAAHKAGLVHRDAPLRPAAPERQDRQLQPLQIRVEEAIRPGHDRKTAGARTIAAATDLPKPGTIPRRGGRPSLGHLQPGRNRLRNAGGTAAF